MSDQQKDRPTDLRARRRPQPAPDERVDPVDYRQAHPVEPEAGPANVAVGPPLSSAEPAVEPRRGRPRREVTIPFSTRLAPDVLELIDKAVESGDGGSTIRSVVEDAIRAQHSHRQ